MGGIVITTVGNVYGCLAVCMIDGAPHWSVESYDGYDWEPCPREVYDAIVKHCIVSKHAEIPESLTDALDRLTEENALLREHNEKLSIIAQEALDSLKGEH